MPDFNPDYIGAGILIIVVCAVCAVVSKFAWRVKFYSAVAFSMVLAWSQVRGAVLRLASLPVGVKPDLLNDPQNAWLPTFLNHSSVYFLTAIATVAALFWFLYDVIKFVNKLTNRYDLSDTHNYKDFTKFVMNGMSGLSTLHDPNMQQQEVVNEEITVTSKRVDDDHIQTTVIRKTETVTQLKEKNNGSNDNGTGDSTVGGLDSTLDSNHS